MNTGIIATRYARALLKYVTETGHGERVYSQVMGLLSDPDRVPHPFEPELERFVELLIRGHRTELLRESLETFCDLYRRANHIMMAHLTTAVPAPELEARLRELVAGGTDYRVVFDTKVDPSIMGGFIFVVDDRMLDASVSRQLELIRREFIQKNNRIV